MNKIETYKGVDIVMGVVCYRIRFFVMNKLFTHFPTVTEAREDIDKTILMNMANEWIEQNKEYFKDVNFTDEDLIQIGKNISNMKQNDN